MNQLEMVNTALAMVGQPPVTDMDATGIPEQRATLLFRPTMDRFLREHPWNFAKTRITLEPASPVPIFEWSERYELPEDFITMVQVNGVACGPTKVGVIYEIEGNELLTNFSTADIQYIRRPLEDSSLDAFLALWDALAVDAFVTLLASKLANPLARDSADLGRALYQQYQNVDLPRARTKNVQESKLPTYNAPIDSRSIRSRSVWQGGNLPGVNDL